MPAKKYTRAAKAPIIDTSLSNLVIVESPAKAKTIKKYLWSDFEVVASMGHITDLAKGDEGVDKTNDFAPSYVVSPDKKKVVSALKKAAKVMKTVWIATDEDREWEAIGRHLCRELKLDVAKTPRIVFREITKDAITHAVSHPRTVNIDLVNAQQARRVLDRLVWFDLSPVLWKKVKSWLSAWRVQSVAVKLLVEKEREVQAFETSTSYKVLGDFVTEKKEKFSAELTTKIKDDDVLEDIFAQFQSATYHVISTEQKPGSKNPSPPFTTSSLQQAASSTLWYSVSRTMQLAQRLYEAGHITYMRTDSMHLSGQAIGLMKGYITKEFGAEYSKTRNFSTKKKGAQEAHECIRPTQFAKPYAWADESQQKLYHLIWQRTLASQMAPAKVQRTKIIIDPQVNWSSIMIEKKSASFVAKWEVITFEWFLKVYDAKQKFQQGILPVLRQGDTVQRDTIVATQVYAKAPARYSEASLVKKLEELGIGRPSTYAPTITTIQKRGYVDPGIYEWTPTPHRVLTLKKQTIKRSEMTKKLWSTKGRLVPTSVGMVVTDFLSAHFPTIMNYQFTAQVEEEFDTIAEGNLKRQDMITTFYHPFHETVEKVTQTADRASGERVLGEDPVTGKSVSVRIGRYGPLVQIGEQGDEDIKYASLPRGLQIETVWLDEALEAFALPRELGEWEGTMIKANKGRFGPYVQRGDVFATLKQPDEPFGIGFDRALVLIQAKIEKDEANTFQRFVYKDKEGKVMKSRWSNVIKRNRKTIKLPKGTSGADITHDEIFAIIDQEVGTKKKKKKTTKRKKSVKKK